ncbi:hypothetical protein TNCT_300721 [Trichonephila clavata]|uniref:Uncharacterized protein n=1 Tax=Trichonephila clavata TaxID=2740835 RepID=A0A8X6JC08_TRICU|nr:hypothetical protein TNCT_300721 [Trichonephila clavata]
MDVMKDFRMLQLIIVTGNKSVSMQMRITSNGVDEKNKCAEIHCKAIRSTQEVFQKAFKTLSLPHSDKFKRVGY